MKNCLPLLATIFIMAIIMQTTAEYLEAKHPVSYNERMEGIIQQLNKQPFDASNNDTVTSLPTPTIQLVDDDKKVDTAGYWITLADSLYSGPGVSPFK